MITLAEFWQEERETGFRKEIDSTMLSRKFYKRLADKFDAERPEQSDPAYETWLGMVYATADAIVEQGQSFNTERFLGACGVEMSEDADMSG